MQSITERLFSLQDKGYKEFQAKLMPTVSKDNIIGVRTPALRKLAKEIYGTKAANEFLKMLPHKYYEQDNLHAFLLLQIKDFDACVKEVERFLPHIDNWATCDSLRPICFKKNAEELLPYIDKWLKSEHVYTVRFGIEMLMVHFLDDRFDVKYLWQVAHIKSDEYYVNMMCAWYFATALCKRWQDALPLIEDKTLQPWVHSKTIQKAVESYCLTAEQKAYLKTLK